ncbi:MAG: hypothetical protein ACLUG5_05105 [Clostridia bacterium]|jgi:hypothetical protein|uniref:hypothetical protein n=1 Tax=Candidatus Merdicola sp. TaxID=3085652 RepID=UPI003A130937
MNIEVNKALITVTVPKENAEELRKAICDAGAGVIGDYTYCTSNSITKGTFIPNNQANPYIGEKEILEVVEEEKIETVCDIKILKQVLKKLREAHPYEEPAINLIPLIDEESL